jgi:hypothetical protein
MICVFVTPRGKLYDLAYFDPQMISEAFNNSLCGPFYDDLQRDPGKTARGGRNKYCGDDSTQMGGHRAPSTPFTRIKMRRDDVAMLGNRTGESSGRYSRVVN